MSEKKKSVKLDSTAGRDKLVGRDTVYIDTEDDITSIIEKVKESDNTVIALVPPKRVGVLQSVVNLKLLQRAAKSGRKKIALVTTDAALIALAAGLRIPVAKNLTAQPELPEAPDLDDTDNDIINGDELAIGDLARVTEKPGSRRDAHEDKEVSAAVAAIETDDKIKNDTDADGVPNDQPKKPKKARRVPNFNDFRKKVFIFGSLGVALIVFLVWAIVFAPSGTITITAETTPKNISVVTSLRPNAATSIDGKVVKPTIEQIKKTETIDFTATGKKEVGEKAKGKVVIYVKITATPMTISSGTALTSGGLQFTLDGGVTISPSSSCSTVINMVPYCTANGTVTASNVGENYNIADNTDLQISGRGGNAYAVASDDFTGGSSETKTVVQQTDLDLAAEKLKNQIKQEDIKTELESQLGGEVVIISDSFIANYGTISSKPALDEVAENGKATATMEITYTLIGISKSDLKSLVEAEIGDLENQKVYDNGVDKVQFKNFAATSDSNYNVTITTTAQIGPDLDQRQDQIKENAVGKRKMEIEEEIGKIPGVSSVKVRFSPFWVNAAPAADKLKVEFAVNE